MRQKAEAVIRKVGNKFCVFSHDGKNLGCSMSKDGAKNRLRQVEYFKHKGSEAMNYNEAFNNFAKALKEGFTPDQLGSTPDSSPRKVEVHSETLSVADSLKTGSIAGFPSNRLLDKKEHFPIITHTQAQSSLTRVMQLTEVPTWYNGELTDLRKDVYAGIMRMHPDIQLNIRVPAEMAVALSDGDIPSDTSQTSIKNPADVTKNQVPSVSRPTLTSAEVEEALKDEDTRKVIAGNLMEMIDRQLSQIQSAKKIGQRLLKSGLKAEEFDQLSGYAQESILRELMSHGVAASVQSVEDRRRELLDRMQNE